MSHAAAAPHRRSLREAWVIMASFAVVTTWVLAVCWAMGYREDRAIRARFLARLVTVAPAGESNDRWVTNGEVFTNGGRMVILGSLSDVALGSEPKSETINIPAEYQATQAADARRGRLPRSGEVLAYPVEDGPKHLAKFFGVPAWAFWGVMLPWAACTVFTIGFALFGIADEAPADEGQDPNNADRAPPFPVKPSESRP